MIANLARSLLIAVSFLTRVRVPEVRMEDRGLGRALIFFPLVGLLLGGILAGLVLIVPLPAAPLAVLLITLLALLTGGLHLDGVADVFDALGGGRGDRQRMLAIMKDSRVGAHGATALILLLAAKMTFLAEVLSPSPREAIPLLLLFPLTARWGVVPLILFFPYARENGIGTSFKTGGRAGDLLGASVFLAAAAMTAWHLHLAPLLISLLVAPTAMLLFALHMRRRLGGLTGDVFGASIELGETLFLLVAILIRSF